MAFETRKNRPLFNGLRLRILSKKEFKGMGISHLRPLKKLHKMRMRCQSVDPHGESGYQVIRISGKNLCHRYIKEDEV